MRRRAALPSPHAPTVRPLPRSARKRERETTAHQHAQNQQRLRPGQAGRLEQESRQHRSDVAARADDAGHRTQRALVDERHHGISGAVRHLDEQARPASSSRWPAAASASARTASAPSPSPQIVQPSSATRPRSPQRRLQRSLTMPPSARANRFIMPNDAGDESGGGQSEMKVVGEIERRDVVDGQLHAEAGAVDHEQRPHARIAASFARIAPPRLMRSVRRGAQVRRNCRRACPA